MKATLKTSADYRSAYRGTWVRGKYFTLVVSPSDSFRYGIVVRKTVGGSVERNRIKRVVRESVTRTSQSRVLLVLVSDSAAGVAAESLRSDLARLLKRLD